MTTQFSSIKSLSKLFLIISLLLSSCTDKKVEDVQRLEKSVTDYRPVKRVLYIDSYHEGLPWVQGIISGIISVLNLSPDDGEDEYKNNEIELKIVHMDTKRNLDDEFARTAAIQAKSVIETWKPDVVIASDDNASKYLIAPYYLNTDLPIVFCGVNWDASIYGFPAANVTGMVEVSLISELINELSKYSNGNKVGFLKGDSYSSRREGKEFEKALGFEIEQVFVSTVSEWEREFLRMQSTVDILLLGNLAAVKDWDDDEEALKTFVLNESKIPSGSWDSWMANIVLVTFANQPEEQGEWAASAVLQILEGISPSAIPIEKNKRAKVFLNMALSKKLGIRFSQEIMDRSHLINAARANKKVLFINSYHKGYVWSDEIEKGFFKAVDTYSEDLDIRIIRMDTKENNNKAFIEAAALKVKNQIDSWSPDIVIGSDDNFSKYVIVPYFMNSDIPFVFCGVNWDASEYGFPVRNVTGMIEVDPIEEVVDILSEYADGPRVGVLSRDDLSSRKIIENVEASGNLIFSKKISVLNYNEWKEGFLELQTSVDSFILMNPSGLDGWNEEDALLFIREHSKIPSGVFYQDQIKYSLLGMTKVAEEQGWWAGNTALKILDGSAPYTIPIEKNKLTEFIVNMPMANHMGIKFSSEVMKDAILWNELSGEENE